jgi:hypothetical protein
MRHSTTIHPFIIVMEWSFGVIVIDIVFKYKDK